MMDGGLTHTDEANTVRSWTFEWTAPAADDLNVDMKIYGNAVNGGNGAGGDHWNQAELSIAGINAGALAPSASALVIFVPPSVWRPDSSSRASSGCSTDAPPRRSRWRSFGAFLKPWLTTTDHKEVGIMYFLFGFFFFLVGGLLALLFRVQLALPENDFMTYDEYNSFFTLHGTTMIFLAAMPMIAGFMNYVLPLQIGAKDLGVPSHQRHGPVAARLLGTAHLHRYLFRQGADITWVMYPPYSSLNEANLGSTLADYGSNTGTTAFISGMLMLGASSTWVA